MDHTQIKTLADALKKLNISEEQFNNKIAGLTPYEAAHIKLITIIEALNDGWRANWKDSSERKYYPWFYQVGSGAGFSFHGYGYAYSPTRVGSRLCFKTSELARYAAEQFQAEYNDYLTL